MRKCCFKRFKFNLLEVFELTNCGWNGCEEVKGKVQVLKLRQLAYILRNDLQLVLGHRQVFQDFEGSKIFRQCLYFVS